MKVKSHKGQGQKSHWSRSKVTRVKVSLKVTGKKKIFLISFDRQVMLEIKSQMNPGKRTNGSWSV